MVELIHTPDPQALLPPILAFLPTAFASPRPPPAFLPLLSPILRQRLQLAGDSRENWLKLLCWDPEKAETLKENIENTTFEPHPSSGEIELGEVQSVTFKRFDEETLRCQMKLEEWHFTPFFLWCTGSDDGDGWKLAEMLPGPTIDETWSASIVEANDSAKERIMAEALKEADAARSRQNLSAGGNEDEYWAQYDSTPGRTPMRKHSMQPGQTQGSEADYYARYGKVQPAMDRHDPDEEMEETAETTLNGNALHNIITQQADQSMGREPPPYQGTSHMNDRDEDEKNVEVQQPVPDSPISRTGSDAVARLEDAAESFNASEMGIRQHIGTTVKSMYRLAKSVGMDREEFERLVQRELETLSIFDRDD